MTIVTEDKELATMFKIADRSDAEKGWLDENHERAYQLSQGDFIDQPPFEVIIAHRSRTDLGDFGEPVLVKQQFFSTRKEAEEYISTMKEDRETRGGTAVMEPRHEEERRAEERRTPDRYDERRHVKAYTSGWATASLVLGIVGIFLAVTILPALLGLVFGFVGVNDVKKNPEAVGKGLAVAGIILGAIGLIAGIAALVWGVQFLEGFLGGGGAGGA